MGNPFDDLIRVGVKSGRFSGEIADALKVLGTELSDDIARIMDAPDSTADDLIRLIGKSNIDEASAAILRSPRFSSAVYDAFNITRFNREITVLGEAATHSQVAEIAAKYGLDDDSPSVRAARFFIDERAAGNIPPRAAASGADNAAGASDEAAERLRALEERLDEVADSTERKKGFWASARSRRTALGTTVFIFGAPIAYGLADKASGGAITHAIVETTKDGIIEAYQSIPPEERKEWLTNKLDTLSTIHGILSFDFIKQEGLNQLVQYSMKEHEIDVTKRKAIAYVLATENLGLVARTYFRMEVLDTCEKDLPIEERNKRVAEGLIQDLIAGCDCIPLRDNPVSERDIVQTIMENRDGIIKHIDKRVQNGLVQLYPELLAVFPEHASFKRESLSEQAEELAERATEPVSREVQEIREGGNAEAQLASLRSGAGDLASGASERASGLREDFQQASGSFFAIQWAKAIGDWFMDNIIKPVLKPILAIFGIKNAFNSAAEVGNPRHDRNVTPEGLAARVGRDNMVGGNAAELDKVTFEGMGGPSDEDADRIMGRNDSNRNRDRNRDREDKPTIDVG